MLLVFFYLLTHSLSISPGQKMNRGVILLMLAVIWIGLQEDLKKKKITIGSMLKHSGCVYQCMDSLPVQWDLANIKTVKTKW